jgi:hypothetical protein
MTPYARDPRWDALQAQAHRPDVQEQIRREIRKGTIRVRPAAGGGIRILADTRPAAAEHAEPRRG